MKSKVPVISLEQTIKGLRELHEKVLKKQIESLERNFQIAPILQDAGFNLEFYEWENLTQICLDNTTDVKDLTRLRAACGCKLVMCGKGVEDSRKHLVYTQLCPENYPDVYIKLISKVKPKTKGGKCKIVRRVSSYTTLVCES